MQTLPKINAPPKNVCGRSFSSKVIAPTMTATSGVTSATVIAFVDSTRCKSQ